jgi:hypothetical protein
MGHYRPFDVFTAHPNSTVHPKAAPHLLQLLIRHRDQFNVISGFLNMTVHQAVRRCVLTARPDGTVDCETDPELQALEDAIHRPQKITAVINMRHTYKLYKLAGWTRDEIKAMCAADLQHCKAEPPAKAPPPPRSRGRRPKA